jgi:hypothetical protein
MALKLEWKSADTRAQGNATRVASCVFADPIVCHLPSPEFAVLPIQERSLGMVWIRRKIVISKIRPSSATSSTHSSRPRELYLVMELHAGRSVCDIIFASTDRSPSLTVLLRCRAAVRDRRLACEACHLFVT